MTTTHLSDAAIARLTRELLEDWKSKVLTSDAALWVLNGLLNPADPSETEIENAKRLIAMLEQTQEAQAELFHPLLETE